MTERNLDFFVEESFDDLPPPPHDAHLRSRRSRSCSCGIFGFCHRMRGPVRNRIDEAFDISDPEGFLDIQNAQTTLRSQMLEATSWNRGKRSPSQKLISGLIDAAAAQRLRRLQESADSDAAFHGHLALVALQGAGTWLTSPPVPDGRHVEWH